MRPPLVVTRAKWIPPMRNLQGKRFFCGEQVFWFRERLSSASLVSAFLAAYDELEGDVVSQGSRAGCGKLPVTVRV